MNFWKHLSGRRAMQDPGAGQKQRSRRSRVDLCVDSLPSKWLPAANVTAALVDGVLTVMGTSGNDEVAVYVDSQNLVHVAPGGVTPKPGGGYTAGTYGLPDLMTPQPVSLVQKVRVRMGAGDDNVVIANFNTPELSRVTGGEGDDLLTALNCGNVALDGSEGDDCLWSFDGSSRNFLNGEEGNDYMKLVNTDRATVDGGSGYNFALLANTKLVAIHATVGAQATPTYDNVAFLGTNDQVGIKTTESGTPNLHFFADSQASFNQVTLNGDDYRARALFDISSELGQIDDWNYIRLIMRPNRYVGRGM